MKAMLATPIAGDQRVVGLCRDPGWAAEPKADGKRIVVQVTDGHVQVFNRHGEPTDLPAAIRAQFTSTQGRLCLDGELCGDTLWLFDLPAADGVLPAGATYRRRRATLDRLAPLWPTGSPVRILQWRTGHEAKADLACRLLAGGYEGVMFKRLDAVYQPGVRADSWRKAKYRKTIDCVVTRLGVDGKANMALAVHDHDGTLVEVGECTALAGDGPRVTVGDIVEVTYLYALSRANPRLVQPTRPMLRTDKPAADCTIDQLQFTNKTVLDDTFEPAAG